ncbi:hypothetical protein QSV08_09780 [Maribacter sp. BPC-D8]|uniref:hypothetical protein n=1 Tax=Maribacter sp. BPC-D8 TaxID=3053613 RepID=UPI002B4949AD|nr:hypothetical protein [Maribacter sp. BPC-D8]WRI31525.1 hypothetical protein QSV08_09780 [Maribacter sp. BPC-D8]
MKLNFRTENIEVSGETYAVNIPEGEIYVAAVYNDVQAAKTIYINFSDVLKEKLSLTQVEFILNYQANYIEYQRRKNPNLVELDKSNIEFLKQRIKSIGRSLSKDEILEIFHAESFYLKLINVID